MSSPTPAPNPPAGDPKPTGGKPTPADPQPDGGKPTPADDPKGETKRAAGRIQGDPARFRRAHC
jgi:hypothetical protein